MYYFPGYQFEIQRQKKHQLFLSSKALSSHLFFTKLIKPENEHS